MKIEGLTALVTGANRGLGRAFVQALRTPARQNLRRRAHHRGPPLPTPCRAGAARHHRCRAGRDRRRALPRRQSPDQQCWRGAIHPALGAPTMEDARLEMETNYFGTLAMCRAFAPVLKRNGGGVMVNMLSVVSFFNAPMQGSYCASKAAAWSLTKAVRFELRAQGTLVIGVYAGYIDTDMTAASTRRSRAPPALPHACSKASRAAPKISWPTNARARCLPNCVRTTVRSMQTCKRSGTASRIALAS